MTGHGQPNPNPEPVDPLAIFSYRGRIGPGAFFGGLLIELVMALLGLVAFAQATNPTGGGGGPGLLLVFIPIIVWMHSLIVVKRMRDAGKPLGAALLFTALPFMALGLTFTAMWFSTSNQKIDDSTETFMLVAFVSLVLMAFPGFMPRKTGDQATQA